MSCRAVESQRCYTAWPSPEQYDMGPWFSESLRGSESTAPKSHRSTIANNATPGLVLTGNGLFTDACVRDILLTTPYKEGVKLLNISVHILE